MKLETGFMSLVSDAVARDAERIHLSIRNDKIDVKYRLHNSELKQTHFSPDELQGFVDELQARMIGQDRHRDEYPQEALLELTTNEGKRTRVRIARMPAYPEGLDFSLKLIVFCSNPDTGG